MRTLLAACLLILTFLPPAAAAGDRVVARVGNEAITLSELESALDQSPDLTRTKALDILIERRLVLVWAAARNISVSDQEVQEVETSIRERNSLTAEQFESALSSRGESLELFRANLREQLTINKALGAALGSQTRASESELRELYSTTYPPSVQFEVSHILLTVDADATPEEDALAREKAEEILSEISSGASFQSMASRYSQDASSAENGGRLGTFKEGELLPELEELAAKVEPGEVGGPVRTAAGYHILLLVSRTTSEPPSFAEVRDTLERQLMMEKEKPARERWLDELKETIYVEVFPDDG